MITIKPVGNWEGQVGQMMRNALTASMEIVGRTGEEACKHALILMAQSARAMTPRSRARRPVLRDARLHGAEYVETYKQGDSKPHKLYRLQFGAHAQARLNLCTVTGTWDLAQKIKNRGLAKRSWMWGLGKLGGVEERTPIPGTSRVYSILGDKACGYIKENRLAYILKIMPAGWETTVQERAAKKILAQAALKMERQWASQARRDSAAVARPLKSFFKAIAA